MECHSELVEAFGNNALPYRTVARWIGKFQQGYVSTSDAQRSGRPVSIRNDLARAVIEQLMEDNLVALHFKYDQARRRFVEWAQNEIAVVPDFHKRILFSDEVHFWLNGYVNKQNCRIWSEANPQVYVETPLHPEKLNVWCALWAGGILLQKRRRPQRYSQW
ncbi:uncharacterized protein TNCV_2716771 [Trichonephila clavipes]|nr:uncharacterized protein TNCV_2716771 [Trichonephila clavipes]